MFLIVALFAVLAAGAMLTRDRSIVMRVPAHYDSIRTLASLVGRVASKARLGEQETFACRLALDEACVNIIEHAYGNQETGEIEVRIQCSPGICTICLTDFGEPYDPSKVAQPRFGSDMDQMNPGGLGLYLMRTMMDDVRYVVGPQGNSLTMVKRRSFQT